MDGLLGADNTAEDLNGAIRYDFVRIHIRGGSGAGLKNIHNKVIVEGSIDNFPGGAFDGVTDLAFDQSKIQICLGGGQFDQPDCADEFTGESKVADREVLNRPLSLRAVQCGRWDPHGSHGVMFNAAILVSSSDRVHMRNPCL